VHFGRTGARLGKSGHHHQPGDQGRSGRRQRQSRPALHGKKNHGRRAHQVLDQCRPDARRLPRPFALGTRGNQGYRLFRGRRSDRLSDLWDFGRAGGGFYFLLRHRISGVLGFTAQRGVYRRAGAAAGLLKPTLRFSTRFLVLGMTLAGDGRRGLHTGAGKARGHVLRAFLFLRKKRGREMALTLTITDVDLGLDLLYAFGTVAVSGNYPSGGDTVDWTTLKGSTAASGKLWTAACKTRRSGR